MLFGHTVQALTWCRFSHGGSHTVQVLTLVRGSHTGGSHSDGAGSRRLSQALTRRVQALTQWCRGGELGTTRGGGLGEYQGGGALRSTSQGEALGNKGKNIS